MQSGQVSKSRSILCILFGVIWTAILNPCLDFPTMVSHKLYLTIVNQIKQPSPKLLCHNSRNEARRDAPSLVGSGRACLQGMGGLQMQGTIGEMIGNAAIKRISERSGTHVICFSLTWPSWTHGLNVCQSVSWQLWEWRNFGRWDLVEGSGLLRKRLQTLHLSVHFCSCSIYLFLLCDAWGDSTELQASAIRNYEGLKPWVKNKSFSSCFCEKIF